MSPAGKWLVSVAWMGLVALATAVVPAHGDQVGAYLREHGLHRLLAAHLEVRLDQTSGAERAETALRLSSLYAEMLEATTDPAEQASLEQRSRKLLDQAEGGGTEELRLALLRNAYRRAEKIAEDHRLRLASAEDIAAAKRGLDELVPQLLTLRQQLKEKSEVAARRHARSSGSDSVTLGEEAEKTAEQLARCTFLAAWAIYYQAWLADRAEAARPAELLFGELLSTETSSPLPSEVSVDLRELEPVARSILGMALCKSLTSSSATALEWVGLLEQSNTFEPVRLQAPVWRLVVHLRHAEYDDVQRLLQARRETGQPAPVAWLRLVAIHAMEDGGRTRLSTDIARAVMTELATRAELDQVLDLSTRYGTQALGDSGFAAQYVQGVVFYRKARDSHGSEAPTLEQAIVELYETAASSLLAAAGQPDAVSYPEPAAACLRMVAWCRYFQSRFLDAKTAFLAAASKLDDAGAADATWMAIVALDKLAVSGLSADLQSELDALIDGFIERWPEHEHTPHLVLRRSVDGDDSLTRMVQELLAIGPESPVYHDAQRRAADLLYQLFRDSQPPRKQQAAHEFLNVATALITVQALRVDGDDADARQRQVARCRQVLEAAFTDGVDRLMAARAALESLDRLRQEPDVDLDEHEDEIKCRRAQERLASDDVDAAATLADQLWSGDQSSLWARLATRSMFKHGYARWRDAEAEPASQRAGLDLVAKYGGRVLREFDDQANPLSLPGSMAYHAAVAQASMQLWKIDGQEERGDAAMFLYERLLHASPRNGEFLRHLAELSEKLGKPDQALDCWRRLVAGAPTDSGLWYESKFNLVRLLAQRDPLRARAVLDQHKALHPSFGPEPWGPMLKGLDEAIPQTATPEASSP